MNAADVIENLSKVFASRDWRAMRGLYHPDALIITVTGGPDPLTPNDVVAELERATDDFVEIYFDNVPPAHSYRVRCEGTEEPYTVFDFTPYEEISELVRGADDFVYLVTADDTIAVDDHAAIVTGRMRRRLPERGFEDAAHVWLLTVREGLVYRQAVYHDAAEALAAYKIQGIRLGMGDPP